MTVWSRIEARLARDIASGRFRPGQRLASEHALAQRFNVNRHTVRQALGSLGAKGLLRVEQGRGTFVADFAVDYLLGRRTRFSENLAAAGHVGAHKLVEQAVRGADAAVAAALELRRGTRMIVLTTLGEARGRPLVFGEHWFPAERFAGLAEHFRVAGSLSAALARFGCGDYSRKRSVIQARLLDESTARQLAQRTGSAAVYVESVNVDRSGVPIEFGRVWFSGERVQLVVAADK